MIVYFDIVLALIAAGFGYASDGRMGLGIALTAFVLGSFCSPLARAHDSGSKQ